MDQNSVDNLAWMIFSLWASLYVCLYIVMFSVRGRTQDLRRQINELRSELYRLRGS